MGYFTNYKNLIKKILHPRSEHFGGTKLANTKENTSMMNNMPGVYQVF